MIASRSQVFRMAILASTLAGLFALPALALPALALPVDAPLAFNESDDPVTSGNEALNRANGGFPWYDAENDDLRRIDVKSTPVRNRTPSSSSFNAPSLNLFAWGVIGVILAVLIYGIIYLFLTHQSDRSLERETNAVSKKTDADRVETLPFSVRRPDADMLAEARRHYESGEYSEAMIYLYSHFLVQLDRHHVIRLTQGKTNRQYVQETNARPPLREILESAMVVFEDVFFGKHTLDRTRFESCWSRLDQFQQHLQQGLR